MQTRAATERYCNSSESVPDATAMKPIVESGIKLVLLWLVGYPAVASLISLIFAGPIAAAESADFVEVFLFLLMLMTLTGIPLTTWAPTGTGGIILALVIAIVQILVLCVFIGVSAGPLIDPFVDAFQLTPMKAGTTKPYPTMKKSAILLSDW